MVIVEYSAIQRKVMRLKKWITVGCFVALAPIFAQSVPAAIECSVGGLNVHARYPVPHYWIYTVCPSLELSGAIAKAATPSSFQEQLQFGIRIDFDHGEIPIAPRKVLTRARLVAEMGYIAYFHSSVQTQMGEMSNYAALFFGGKRAKDNSTDCYCALQGGIDARQMRLFVGYSVVLSSNRRHWREKIGNDFIFYGAILRPWKAVEVHCLFQPPVIGSAEGDPLMTTRTLKLIYPITKRLALKTELQSAYRTCHLKFSLDWRSAQAAQESDAPNWHQACVPRCLSGLVIQAGSAPEAKQVSTPSLSQWEKRCADVSFLPNCWIVSQKARKCHSELMKKSKSLYAIQCRSPKLWARIQPAFEALSHQDENLTADSLRRCLSDWQKALQLQSDLDPFCTGRLSSLENQIPAAYANALQRLEAHVTPRIDHRVQQAWENYQTGFSLPLHSSFSWEKANRHLILDLENVLEEAWALEKGLLAILQRDGTTEIKDCLAALPRTQQGNGHRKWKDWLENGFQLRVREWITMIEIQRSLNEIITQLTAKKEVWQEDLKKFQRHLKAWAGAQEVMAAFEAKLASIEQQPDFWKKAKYLFYHSGWHEPLLQSFRVDSERSLSVGSWVFRSCSEYETSLHCHQAILEPALESLQRALGIQSRLERLTLPSSLGPEIDAILVKQHGILLHLQQAAMDSAYEDHQQSQCPEVSRRYDGRCDRWPEKPWCTAVGAQNSLLESLKSGTAHWEQLIQTYQTLWAFGRDKPSICADQQIQSVWRRTVLEVCQQSVEQIEEGVDTFVVYDQRLQPLLSQAELFKQAQAYFDLQYSESSHLAQMPAQFEAWLSLVKRVQTALKAMNPGETNDPPGLTHGEMQEWVQAAWRVVEGSVNGPRMDGDDWDDQIERLTLWKVADQLYPASESNRWIQMASCLAFRIAQAYQSQSPSPDTVLDDQAALYYQHVRGYARRVLVKHRAPPRFPDWIARLIRQDQAAESILKKFLPVSEATINDFMSCLRRYHVANENGSLGKQAVFQDLFSPDSPYYEGDLDGMRVSDLTEKSFPAYLALACSGQNGPFPNAKSACSLLELEVRNHPLYLEKIWACLQTLLEEAASHHYRVSTSLESAFQAAQAGYSLQIGYASIHQLRSNQAVHARLLPSAAAVPISPASPPIGSLFNFFRQRRW